MEAFLQYLEKHYFEMFFKKIKLFVAQNHDLIEEKFNGKRIGFIGVEDLYFKKVWINDDKNDEISFDVLIYPELNATVKFGHGDEDSQGLNNLLLLCTGTLRISKDLECLKIDSVEEYSSKNPSNKQLDGNLVPYIQKSEYSSCAAEILRKYYPSGLENPRFINIRTVAKNMGLKILNRRIDKNKTVFGQFYFFAGNGKFYDEKKDEYYTEWIPQNTIIVDSSANYLYSYGSENLTIAHECVHAYLHKKAFIFARLAQKDLKCITCNNSGDNRYNNKTLQWVEFQANSIAPYLLTPDTTFKIKIDELFNERLNGENYDPLLDVQEIINDAASFFGITKQSVRKRMIDCGYEEAIGCFNWLDAGYIRPYLFKKGSLKKNETYSIRTNDFYHAMTSNPKILGGIYNGYLVFVENHVIVNHPKYLIDDNGNFILTEYARRHLDECAVKFIAFPKNKQNENNAFASSCYLCKETNINLQFDVRVSDGTDISSSSSAIEALNNVLKEKREISKLIAGRPLPEMLRNIKEYKHLTNKEIAIDGDLDERTVSRYLNGENKTPDKRTLLALCIGLSIKLPALIEQIFKEAGISFKTNSIEDEAFSLVVYYLPGHDIHYINQALINMGQKPLTKEKL